MPARHWVPLGTKPPVSQQHLHAALSAWFDDEDCHHANVKPYTISPLTLRDDSFGVEITTLNKTTSNRIADHAKTRIRLGRQQVQVEAIKTLESASWAEMADRSDPPRLWQIQFLTPTLFRTQGRPHPWPQPQLLIRAAVEIWDAFADRPVHRFEHGELNPLTVEHLELRSETVLLGSVQVMGVVGQITVSVPARLAAEVAPLFRLANFSGVGSYRTQGLGLAVFTPLR